VGAALKHLKKHLGILSPMLRLQKNWIEMSIDAGLKQISNIYIDPLDIREVVEDGIEGVLNIDKSFVLKKEPNHFKLFYNRVLVTHYSLPMNKDPEEWARLSYMVLEDARTQSDRLKGFETEKIYEAYFDTILKELDRFSRYTTRKEAEYYRHRRKGYEGIGIVIEHKNKDDDVVIKKVLPGGPADEKGIRVGFKIIEVDGESVTGKNLLEVSNLITKGDTKIVQLTALRPGEKVPQNYAVKKKKIIENPVESNVKNDIAYIKLNAFNSKAAARVKEAIQDIKIDFGKSIKGYVLDVSDNPGGLLDEAIDISDLFLNSGKILTAKGRNKRSMQKYVAFPGDILEGAPLIVFINQDSASASEVVAAALDDNHRAVLVGTKSYGKGSIQNIYSMPNQAELYLTWAKMQDPSGDIYHGVGIQPDVCVAHKMPANKLVQKAIKQKQQKIEAVSCDYELENEDANMLVAEIIFSDRKLYDRLR
jgi:carboxyl-terminal processing protease